MKVLEQDKENREWKLDQEPQATPDIAETLLRPQKKTQSIREKQDKRKALYLDAGQTHNVWKPFTDVVVEVVKNRRDLLKRQQTLQSRVVATNKVLKVQREELALSSEGDEEVQQTTPEEKKRWQKAIVKVMEENTKVKKSSKKNMHFHDAVTQYVGAMSTSSHDDAAQSTTPTKRAAFVAQKWRSQLMKDRKRTKRYMKPEANMQTHTAVDDVQPIPSAIPDECADSKV